MPPIKAGEKKIDPDDGKECTFKELQAKFEGQGFTEDEVRKYWAEDCRAIGAAAVKPVSSKPKTVQDSRRIDFVDSQPCTFEQMFDKYREMGFTKDEVNEHWRDCEQRFDKDDEEVYTWKAIQKKYEGKYKYDMLKEYWNKECKVIADIDELLRVDPGDGKPYCWTQVQEIYERDSRYPWKDAYDDEDIKYYWDHEMKPLKAPICSAKTPRKPKASAAGTGGW
eukprot:gnl/MRDRNA2_/MRDRNA2_118117_c0_seq1.p1 gnl/MRDRNA2_/MRDRNA2_118117_c0~~gnl/MRDRNA2_/MRDRNA2_118117_c0_seq1.p1  ORF type:complete len:248 (-),score=70.04 gnl/MRDRNA2_/MRDRNA2_118117_c0_seq1:14-682(-)